MHNDSTLPQNFKECFQRFGSLVGLVLSIPEIHFTTKDLALTYEVKSNHIYESKMYSRPDLTYPLEVDDRMVGELHFKLTVTSKNKEILKRLIQDFGYHLRLQKTDLSKKEKQIYDLSLEKNLLNEIIKQMPAGLLVMDKATNSITFTNEQMKIIQGRSSLGLNFGKDFMPEAYHPDGSKITYMEWPGIRSLEFGETVNNEEIKYRSTKGKITYLSSSSAPVLNHEGKIAAAVIVARDVTKLKKIERRDAFLSRISSILIESLNFQETIYKLADACVPELADGCIIDLLEDKKINRLVSKHENPDLKTRLEAAYQQSSKVMMTGNAELIKENINRHIDFIKSCISVPLVTGKEIIGTIGFFITSDRESFDETDLATATEMARRAGLAIMNSKLFQDSQKAISLRDDFISIASHELKTPITSMKLQLQLAEKMMSKEDSENLGLDYFKSVTQLFHKQLSRITVLVEDMLNVSRISSGKLAITLSKLNVSQLAKDVLHRLSYELENLTSFLQINIQEGVIAKCDGFRIEQVIINLLTNAIRYGEGKQIKVTLIQEANEVIIKVIDEGPGIAPEDQHRIFEKFERAVSSKYISGMGLGLYISRQIMEQHNGSLSVESLLSKGSTFTMRFPIA